MKKIYSFFLLLGLMLSIGNVWAEEVIYKSLIFSANDATKVGSYTSSWVETIVSDSWTITHFNNNSWNWDATAEGASKLIKCGRKKASGKNTPSVADIKTNAAMAEAITKVIVTFEAINATDINSIKLYVASDADFTADLQTITPTTPTSAGALTIAVTSPAANRFYKLEIDTKGATSSNGHTSVSKVDYYYNYVSPANLESITLSGTYPTTFLLDDEFSHTGIVVTANYDNESSTEVTNSADFSGYDMSVLGNQTVTVSYTEKGITKTATYNITVNPIPVKTVTEFIAAGGTKCYLVGTVGEIKNSTYGNYDLTDASGTIYVYGTLTPSKQSAQFSTLGIEEGDVIKVLAKNYTLYSGTTDEAVNVIFVSEFRSLTIESTGYATYYNSAEAYVMPEDCEGNVFTVANGLQVGYMPGEVVPAGEGLVIYTIEPGTKFLEISETTEPTFASLGENDLKGTDAAATTTGGNYYYGLSLNSASQANSIGFYWMAAGGAAFTNGAHKAYLALNELPAGAPERILFNNNDATNINNIDAIEDAVKFIENGQLFIKKNGVVYDAMGKTVR